VTAGVSWVFFSSGEEALPGVVDNGGPAVGRSPDSVPLVVLLGAVFASAAGVLSKGTMSSTTAGLSEPSTAAVVCVGASPHIRSSGERESDCPRGLDITVLVDPRDLFLPLVDCASGCGPV
jgi:hypothetical protein